MPASEPGGSTFTPRKRGRFPFQQSIYRRTNITTCPGYPSYVSCGLAYPNTFCCPQGQACLRITTSAAIAAAHCCPSDSDCSSVAPIMCAEPYQDEKMYPLNVFHSDPTQSLETCGVGCCPPLHSCMDGNCVDAQWNQTQLGKGGGGSSNTTSNRTNSQQDGGIYPVQGGVIKKAIIVVSIVAIVALAFAIGFGYRCWFLQRRKKGNEQTDMEMETKREGPGFEKPELDTPATMALTRVPAEVDGERSPREISFSPKRVRTVNSVRQELDAAGEPRVRRIGLEFRVGRTALDR